MIRRILVVVVVSAFEFVERLEVARSGTKRAAVSQTQKSIGTRRAGAMVLVTLWTGRAGVVPTA